MLVFKLVQLADLLRTSLLFHRLVSLLLFEYVSAQCICTSFASDFMHLKRHPNNTDPMLSCSFSLTFYKLYSYQTCFDSCYHFKTKLKLIFLFTIIPPLAPCSRPATNWRQSNQFFWPRVGYLTAKTRHLAGIRINREHMKFEVP